MYMLKKFKQNKNLDYIHKIRRRNIIHQNLLIIWKTLRKWAHMKLRYKNWDIYRWIPLEHKH